MSENAVEDLLARLAGRGADSAPDLYTAVAATQPDHAAPQVAAVHPVGRDVAAVEAGPMARASRGGGDERLSISAHRQGTRTGPAAGGALHLLRRGAGRARGIYRQRRRPIAHHAASHLRRSAAG